MWFRSVLESLKLNPGKRRRRQPRRAPAARLLLEALEDRTVPSFAAAVNYATGNGPQAVVTGDINGDGKPDLTTINYQGNTVSVMLGKGDGTFQAAKTYSTGTGPVSLAVGDINGDGKLDLVTANLGGDLSVLLGNGDGTFGSATSVSLPDGGGLTQAPLSMAVGDLNGDGKLDLVVTGQTSYSQQYGFFGTYGYYGPYFRTVYQGYVNVLVGDGKGGFTAGDTQALNSTTPSSVQVGDLNGDGKPDVVTANQDLSSVGVLLGNGDGTLGTETDYNVSGSPTSVAVGDLNGDGKLDVVTANGASVSALLGNGDGTFQTAKQSSFGATVESLALADLNGDGNLDVVATNSSGGKVNALLGKGDGTFSPPVTATVGSDPLAVAAGDFNGDGKPDLAVANAGSANVSVLLNDGTWPAANAPTASVNSVSVTEGNSGTTNAVFTVSLSAAYSKTITVNYSTADGAATAGSDYTSTSGTLTFAPGQTTATFSVPVIGDRIAEPNETFTVTLSQPTNAFLSLTNSTGTGTIIDDEPRISINNVSLNEGNKGKTAFVFTVSLSVAYDQPVTVHYATQDGSATTADGDYVPTSGTLTFQPGQTTATITVYVNGNRQVEPNETFYLVLSDPSSNALITNADGLGTILNDDHSRGGKHH
jgi:hypothetical protein